MAFVDVLEHMGCTRRAASRRHHRHRRPAARVDVDMNAISDTVMTLAVVALFAHGVTRIRNVAHIRHKETGPDRRAGDRAAQARRRGR